MALAEDINKLRDDVALSEEKFVKESFLTSSEAAKYVGELPGIKDILGAIEGFISAFTDIVDAIKGLVDAIMSFINSIISVVNNAVNTVNGIIASLFGQIFGKIFGSGYSLEKRDALFNLFKKACNSSLPNLNANGLNSIALVGVIMGISCIAQPKTYSTTLDLFKSNPSIQSKRDELRVFIDRRELYNSFEEQEYDSNGFLTGNSIPHNDIPYINSEIARLENEIYLDELAIDELFATATPELISAAAVMPSMPISSAVGFIEDISNTPSGVLAADRTDNLPEIILEFLANSYDESVITNPNINGYHSATNDTSIHFINGVEESNIYQPDANYSIDTNHNELNKEVYTNVYFKRSESSIFKAPLNYFPETLVSTNDASKKPFNVVAIPTELKKIDKAKLVKVIKDGEAYNGDYISNINMNLQDITSSIEIVRNNIPYDALDINTDISTQVPAPTVTAVNNLGKQNVLMITSDISTVNKVSVKRPIKNTPITINEAYEKMFVSPLSNTYIDFGDYKRVINGLTVNTDIGVANDHPSLNFLLMNKVVGGITDKNSFIKLAGGEEEIFETMVDVTPNDSNDILTSDPYIIKSSEKFTSTVTESVLLERLFIFREHKQIVENTYSKYKGVNTLSYASSNHAEKITDLSGFELVAENGNILYENLMSSFIRFDSNYDLSKLAIYSKHNLVFKLLCRNKLLNEEISDINTIEDISTMTVLPAILSQV